MAFIYIAVLLVLIIQLTKNTTMKKLFLAVFSLFAITAATQAQEKAPAKKEDNKMKVAPAKTAPAKVVKMDNATKQTAKTAAPASTAGPAKKDGTPDKRFKANKAAPAATPTKKDGTPDMRYKENKAKPKS